jgi:hypothetical protein
MTQAIALTDLAALKSAARAKLGAELAAFAGAAVEALVERVVAPDAYEYAEVLMDEQPAACSCGHCDAEDAADESSGDDEPGDTSERETAGAGHVHRGRRGGRKHRRQDG